MMVSKRALLGAVIIPILIFFYFLSQYDLYVESPQQESAPLENNVISMSIWGDGNKYLRGAIRNAQLVKTYFPGWTLRVYVETRTKPSVYGRIPQLAMDKLEQLGVDFHYMDPAHTCVPPRMWRFLVADDFSVDHFIIRDSDSRLSARDFASVQMWVKSGKAFNCQRDHPIHGDWAIMGGMWGAKPAALHEIMKRNFSDMMCGYKTDYFADQNFLKKHVWPRVKSQAYCSDSQTCDKWEGSHPFPTVRMRNEHVGGVYTEWDVLLASPDVSDNVKCQTKQELTEAR